MIDGISGILVYTSEAQFPAMRSFYADTAKSGGALFDPRHPALKYEIGCRLVATIQIDRTK